MKKYIILLVLYLTLIIFLTGCESRPVSKDNSLNIKPPEVSDPKDVLNSTAVLALDMNWNS